ncbi:hypothetical protein [Spongiibacter sp. UBA1325]|jgi:hypothetical protein|uniref:hypothetical protein n=1 Tax=Spongiibacter sp. UBA1325 TaxID=1947543 RepID=UPI0025802046|nr:hypothetical protein [Spongiibacter sp. UBA1325]|tara:strand:- start:4203 stop:6107 length:1905 start_codon:yes stop_codon:yes gene_type:complete
MTASEYGFYFEKQGLSGEEGPIDPSQQYFEGAHADHAVVRETGQNTLDNRGTSAVGPIQMEFELTTMATRDIPGIEGLREHLDAVAEQTVNQQGHDRMEAAARLAKEEAIPVLRISDYNTTGLTGSEALSSSGSPLSRLTRGKGGSSDDERGGSFGIGSAVGPMASNLCTVLYTTMPEDTRDTVLAGYTRLATHTLGKTSYRAEGYFTKLACESDFEYQRPAIRVGPFSERTEPGTDTYVLGYRMADSDPNLERVRDAVIDNFMAAIDRGRLVVKGITKENEWTLDADSLERFVRNRPEARAFYEALQDPEPAEATLRKVGKVRLYINVDDRLEKKLHTITMRRPLMKIDLFKHNSISAKYAAVLVCDSEEGNKYLRRLEPPQHHVWDAARDPVSGAAVIRDMKTFVRDSLRERITTEIGDVVEIEGLSRFLPTESIDTKVSGAAAAPTSEPDSEGSETESSTVTGRVRSGSPTVIPPNTKIQVKIQRPATSGGETEVQQGKPTGGTGERKTKDAGLPGKGTAGVGTSRINGNELQFRSWSTKSSDPDTAVMALAITSHEDECGDLELLALGPGGEPEEGFKLPISRVVLHGVGKTTELSFSENTITKLSLQAGQMTRIDVYMPAGERYRLGVA